MASVPKLGRSELKTISSRLLLLIHPDKFATLPSSITGAPTPSTPKASKGASSSPQTTQETVTATNASAVATVNSIVSAVSKLNLSSSPSSRPDLKPRYDLSFYVWRDSNLMLQRVSINLPQSPHSPAVSPSVAASELRKVLSIADGTVVPPSPSSDPHSSSSRPPPPSEFLGAASDLLNGAIPVFTPPARSAYVFNVADERRRLAAAKQEMDFVLSGGPAGPAAAAHLSGMISDARARTDAVKKSAIADVVGRVRRVDENWIDDGDLVNADGKRVATTILSGAGNKIDIVGMVACRRLSNLFEKELLSTYLQEKITPPPIRRGRRSLTKEESIANAFIPSSTALYDMLSGDGLKWSQFHKMQILVGPSSLSSGADDEDEDAEEQLAKSWSYDMKPQVDILDGAPSVSKKPILHVLMPEDFTDEQARVFLECVFRDFIE